MILQITGTVRKWTVPVLLLLAAKETPLTLGVSG